MREQRYRVRIPDLDYYRELIKCQAACPIHTSAGCYVTAIAREDYEEAYALARKPNPFVYTLGRVCGHPCEDACRRGEFDAPVAICALKRVATEHHNLGLGHSVETAVVKKKAQKVAIVGAGPAGLSAAHDLARMGYQVTVFEASGVAGGMLNLGLPVYRLPKDIVKLEVDAILHLGVELRLHTPLGPHFTLQDLRRQGYHAIFIAVGAGKSRDLKIEGVELDGVLKGVEFLLNINLGYRVELGERVIVIGGGNVAVDVARSVVRRIETVDIVDIDEIKETLDIYRATLRRLLDQHTPSEEGLTVAMDAARSALRLGAKEVRMVCLESLEEMPAHKKEIAEAQKEGILLSPSRGPKRIIGRDGKVVGLETIACSAVFDQQGRFNPTFVEGTEEVIPADTIILAIGQTSDFSFIQEEDGIQLSPRGTIAVDPDTLATSAPGIFAGGDAAFGPRLIVHAIADGQKAARAIDAFLSGGEKRWKTVARFHPLPHHRMPEHYLEIGRHEMPTLPLNRRVGIAEVELGFADADAVEEGKRCLQCFINPIFDGDKCILCGGCVDVCPENCLRLVRIQDLEGDEDLERLLQIRYGGEEISLQPDLSSWPVEGSAMLKEEDRCIRCGLCALRCPTGAISMEFFEWQERVERAPHPGDKGGEEG
ncbi:MAG: FAD-dependent oxidoreductase [Nitrospinota bacterium]|nr:MAG: FAD-dependent oxidoreductase [Nitrospinota bacterium]